MNNDSHQQQRDQALPSSPALRAGGFASLALASALLLAALALALLSTSGADAATAIPGPPGENPDQRGYEMVSPLDKNGDEVTLERLAEGEGVGVAADGDAVAWASPGGFAGSDSGTPFKSYVSSRDASSGWSTVSISPTLASRPVEPFYFASVDAFSADLSQSVVRSNAELTPDASAIPDNAGLYLQQNGVSPSFDLLSAPASSLLPAAYQSLAFAYQASTADLSHVVFNSSRQLLPEGAADNASANGGVYDATDSGLAYVSVVPAGLAPATAAYVGANRPTSFFHGSNPISADGSRIYFSVNLPSASGGLYLREDAEETKIVSASERTGDDPNKPNDAEFLHATADGSAAFFMAGTKLTDDASAGAGADLYRWDADAEPGSRLTDLTTADPDGGGVLGLAGADDAGDHVYFVATGDLAPGAVDGEPNLYVWQSGQPIRLVATLDSADGSIWSWRLGPVPNNHYRDARVSADGTRLLFASRAQLTGYDTAGTRQIYLYDAVAATDPLICVSCSSRNDASSADAAFAELGPHPRVLPRNLSADGDRAFFQTPERLVDEDTNGRLDVYEWQDGRLSLVSDGRSAESARFMGASLDGDDVFIVTRAQLVRGDTDNRADVYDVRSGGGFAEQPPGGPCVGDACQAPPTAPPPPTDPGSSEFTGPGNARCRGLERASARAEQRQAAVIKRAQRLQQRAKRSQHRSWQLKRKASRRASDGRRLRQKAQRAHRRAKRLARKVDRLERRATWSEREARQLIREARECKRDPK